MYLYSSMCGDPWEERRTTLLWFINTPVFTVSKLSGIVSDRELDEKERTSPPGIVMPSDWASMDV